MSSHDSSSRQSASSAVVVGGGAVARLEQFRAELAELAFSLERTRRYEAADVALELRTKLGELANELAAAAAPGPN